MSKFKISTDGENWKEIVSSPDKEEVIKMTMTYVGVRHVMMSDNGDIFTLEADHCDMEVGKKYEIKLP